jgi:hypothetical protein
MLLKEGFKRLRSANGTGQTKTGGQGETQTGKSSS